MYSPENWKRPSAERSSSSGQVCLIAPRDIPHRLRNPGIVENHYLLMFSPPGFDEFLRVTAVPAPHNAAVPAEHIPVAVCNVREVAADYGIFFG
jgi:hypothetical protein